LKGSFENNNKAVQSQNTKTYTQKKDKMSKKKKDKSGSNNIYALTEAEQMALDTL